MGAYGDPIRVAVVKEPLPDLSSAGVFLLMEEALIIAEQSRVDAVTRRNALKKLWLVREYRAGRRYDDEEGQRAAEAYANGEGSRDSEWKAHVADNQWHMSRVTFYANVLLARKAYEEMGNWQS
jgi:hypothetical protein